MGYKIKTKSGMAGPFTAREIAALFRKGKIHAGAELRGENDELLLVSEVIPVTDRWEAILLAYVIFCWICPLFAGVFLTSGRSPASLPGDSLGYLVYFIIGIAGLGCLNVLLSAALLFMHELKSALALFLNPPGLVFIIALIILGSQ
jgi:hypothetical protein